jgi:hypothetical protein
LIKNESLTDREANLIISGIDKRLFAEQLISLLKYKHLLTESEIMDLFIPTSQAELSLPLSIFANPELSALEAICRYLRDEKGYRYSEIAQLLNRDQRTIWVTYSNSLKKKAGRLDISDSKYLIPLSLFQDRKLSVLEALVHHLKDTYHLKYSEIAQLINRDERNIWGIYNKAGRKLKNG